MEANLSNDQPELPLERYRSYLLLIAKLQADRWSKGKLDASDIVQQTFVKAHQARAQFHGNNSGELAAWLRKILIHAMADAIRDLRCGKRDAGLEQSLQASVNNSSCQLEQLIAAHDTSPSQHALRAERFLMLSDALTQLPQLQRDALLLKHCQGLSLVEVGGKLGKTPAAVASLMRRGLEQLRQALAELE